MKDKINRLHNESEFILRKVVSISEALDKINTKNVNELRVVENIKKLVNNTIAEVFILNDFLFQLTELTNESDLEFLLELNESESNESD